ncbi:MAG: hypothetical protein ABIH37_03820 [archaeon]
MAREVIKKEEDNEEVKDIDFKKIVDETLDVPNFRRIALEEMAPLGPSETGTLEQGFRSIRIQRLGSNEEEQGIYDTDRQTGREQRPGEAYTRVEDYASGADGDYGSFSSKSPDGSSGRMISGSMPSRFENPWGTSRDTDLSGTGMASGMDRTGRGNAGGGFQQRNYDPAEEKTKRDKRRM